MNASDYESPVTMETAPNLPVRKFRLRTILVPILFLGLHFIVINIVATFYILIYALLSGNGQGADILQILSDPEMLEAITRDQYPVITVIYALALIPVYLIYLFLNRRRDPQNLMLDRMRLSDALPALAMMIGALGVTNIWFTVLVKLQESVPFIDRQMKNYLETASAFTPNSGYLWLILGISIMAPVVEELVFRGIIQGELRKAMPEWLAIIIQAIIFALFHMQVIQISYVLLPGLLLGLAYYWSRSIWVPIFMHVTFNFLGSVLPAWIGEDETLNSILFFSESAFILVGLLAGVFFWMNHRRKSAEAISLPTD